MATIIEHSASKGSTMSPDLAALLEQASKADPASRIEFRDQIARHGGEAIEAVSPWVADSRLGRFAVVVIGAAHGFGAPEAAIDALETLADKAATPEIESDIIWWLGRLAPKPKAPRRPRSSRNMSPIQKLLLDPTRPARYMRAWTLWHRILDEIRLPDGRTKYMSPCHHWNSEAYVNGGDRRIQETVPRAEFCWLCDRAEGGVSSGRTSSAWASIVAPWGNDGDRLHLRSDRTWHRAADDDAVEATKLGSVYLTECGWWVESSRVRASRAGSERSPVCEACVRFVRARTSGQREI